MAYTVDWQAKSIFVPVADMTLVSGSEYELDMTAFRVEIRRLEWEFDEGMGWPQVLEHTKPKTLAGVAFAGFDEIINGYTITFDPVATKVTVKGTNNNIVDVLVINGVSVIPSNSAGLVQAGSGLTATQDQTLTMIKDLLEADEIHTAASIIKYLRGTNSELLNKSVTGSSLTQTLSITE